jgi:osmotically inducible protein OsmC
MAIRTAAAEWKGDLKGGDGTFKGESGEIEGAYSFGSRFEEAGGTNPEELIGAAHASCFSMQFSGLLAAGGHTPESVSTEAKVQVLKEGGGFAIKKIDLVTTGRVSGIDEDEFQQTAQAAKDTCPVSMALAAVPEINLTATLES